MNESDPRPRYMDLSQPAAANVGDLLTSAALAELARLRAEADRADAARAAEEGAETTGPSYEDAMAAAQEAELLEKIRAVTEAFASAHADQQHLMSRLMGALVPLALPALVDVARNWEDKQIEAKQAREAADRNPTTPRKRGRERMTVAHFLAHERISAVERQADLAADFLRAAVGTGAPIVDLNSKLVHAAWTAAGSLTKLYHAEMGVAYQALAESKLCDGTPCLEDETEGE